MADPLTPTESKLLATLQSMLDFKPDPAGGDAYVQMAGFMRRTARAAIEEAARDHPQRWGEAS